MQLTEHQQQAFDAIITHLRTDRIVLLQGSAGTGKTTLTKYIADYFYDAGNIAICAIAPTHKARRVITAVLNQDAIIPITSFTIASALSKIREHSNIGTKLYGQANLKKLSSFDLFLIDEVSMISDEDMRVVLGYVRATGKMALLIGDNNQIPCPSAGFRRCGGSIEKADNYVFGEAAEEDQTGHKEVLSEVVRQAKDSPIIKLATYIRENINADIPLPTFAHPYVIPYEAIYAKYAEYVGSGGHDPAMSRVIAYTNAAVRTHNLEIRRMLHPDADAPFIVGDVLMGYATTGPNDVVENGQDYLVSAVNVTAGYKVGEYAGLCGWFIDLQICGTGGDGYLPQTISNLFFINIYKSANKAYINELIRRAQQVNAPRSTGKDWQKYKELKTPVMFIDDIYKYSAVSGPAQDQRQGKIFTDTTFRETHPLLFTNIAELVDFATGTKRASQLLSRIEKEYIGLIESRIEDAETKRLNDSEQLADAYKVIERDIYYGYAITAHKSQGSTYDNVIVDEGDFNKLVNRWNNKHGCMESRVREKNQLRYVAYTRARRSLAIAYSVST